MNGATLLLAAASLSPAPQRTSEGMKSGPWGLAMILLLCIAVYFLWRSMNRHLRKVGDRTDPAGRWSMSSGARGAGPAPRESDGDGSPEAGADVTRVDAAASDAAPPDSRHPEPGQASAASATRAVEQRDQSG